MFAMRCGLVDLAVLGEWLDMMILEVFHNQNESSILWHPSIKWPYTTDSFNLFFFK